MLGGRAARKSGCTCCKPGAAAPDADSFSLAFTSRLCSANTCCLKSSGTAAKKDGSTPSGTSRSPRAPVLMPEDPCEGPDNTDGCSVAG